MRQLEETPAEGMYVTREEARGYAILTAALGALLFLMILFKGRKKMNPSPFDSVKRAFFR